MQIKANSLMWLTSMVAFFVCASHNEQVTIFDAMVPLIIVGAAEAFDLIVIRIFILAVYIFLIFIHVSMYVKCHV